MGSLASDNTGIAPSLKRSGYPASLEQAGIEGKAELRSHMQRKLREENKEEIHTSAKGESFKNETVPENRSCRRKA